jgi:hypothetical protein
MQMSGKKVLSLLALSLAALFVAGSQNPARAQASNVTSNASFPFTDTAATCGDQTVNISGKMHLLAHVTTDAQGGRHAILEINTANVKGTDDAGNQYVSSSTNDESINDAGADGTQNESTITTKFLLVGKGNLPDLLVKTTLHVTVNASGEVTADVTNVVAECH